MENKINLVEILKDCPSGMALDCTIFNNVTFSHIKNDGICIEFSNSNGYKHNAYLDCEGCLFLHALSAVTDKCVIYPKGKDTWEGFMPPNRFKDGDIVFYNNTIAIFKEWGDETLFRTYVTSYLYCDSLIDIKVPLFGKYVRREIRFATEEEKQKLFQAIKDNGYRWNSEAKALEEIESKFKDGDIVAMGTQLGAQLFIFKEYVDIEKNYAHCYMMLDSDGSVSFEDGIYYVERLATEEEVKKLHDTINAGGLQWNPEAKTLEEIKPKFKDGDIVFHKFDSQNCWISIFNKHENDRIITTGDYCINSGSFCSSHNVVLGDIQDLEECRFATNSERKIYFNILKEKGFKYDSTTKTLKRIPKFNVGDKIVNTLRCDRCSWKISQIEGNRYIFTDGSYIYIKDQDNWELVPDKFNINDLVPFESKVLVRSYTNALWRPAIFGCYIKDKPAPYFVLGGLYWRYCIPYEGNEHLRGKTDDCNSFYKTWCD